MFLLDWLSLPPSPPPPLSLNFVFSLLPPSSFPTFFFSFLSSYYIQKTTRLKKGRGWKLSTKPNSNNWENISTEPATNDGPFNQPRLAKFFFFVFPLRKTENVTHNKNRTNNKTSWTRLRVRWESFNGFGSCPPVKPYNIQQTYDSR